MERDHVPSTPPEAIGGDGEKKRRRKRKSRESKSADSRRLHVPLPIEAETAVHAHNQAEKAKETVEAAGSKKKKKKSPEDAADPVKAEANAEPTASEQPESRQEKKVEKEDDSKAEAEAEKTADHIEAEDHEANEAEMLHENAVESAPKVREDSELAEIPLDAEDAEEILLVSDRWRRQNQTEEATSEESQEDAEPESAPDKGDATEASAEKDKDEPPAANTRKTTATPPVLPPLPPRPATPNTPPPVPTPPAVPPFGPGRPPVPPFNPNIYPTGGGNILPPVPLATAANRLPNPNPNTVNQFQERRHNGRAILAGILVGGLIEHIRHKRREKRTEKAHTKEVKELKKEHDATRFQLREQEIKGEEAARKKTALERQLERLQKTSAEVMPLAAAAETTIRQPKAETAPVLQKVETTRKTEVALAPERPKVEKQLDEAEEAIKKAQEAVERAHQNLDEQPELPPDRKVEASSWHRIEVDKKTGKAVEDPTLAYGEEFKHEQHQELLLKATDEASLQSDKIREQYSPFQTLPTPNATIEEKKKKALPSGKLSPKDQAVQKARDVVQNANPVDIGLWAVLIIVIFLIIAAL